jgi:hypothetical protein
VENNDREILAKFISELIKTIKVVSVYPENNPLPIKLRESFSERFSEFVVQCGKIRLVIGRDTISYDGKPVYRDTSDDEKPASLFHNAGITEISFGPTFGYEQANQFLVMMKKFLNRAEGSDDLVMLLWKSNIEGFDYQTLEDSILGEYEGDFFTRESNVDDPLSDSRFINQSDSGKLNYNSIFLDDSDETTATKPPEKTPIAHDELWREKMGWHRAQHDTQELSDNIARLFDRHFRLQESDAAIAAALLEEETRHDLYKLAVGLTRELVMQEDDYVEFIETITVCEKFHTDVFEKGRIDCAVDIADFIVGLETRIPAERYRWKERLNTARAALGAKDTFVRFGRALNATPDFPPEEIERYLGLFGWEALASVADLLGELQHRTHRLAVCNYLCRANPRHVDILAKGIFDRRWFVVRNTAMILARIGGQRALTFLEKAARHEDPRVRREVAFGLIEASSPGSIYLLKEFIWDNDSEISLIAVEALLKIDRALAVDLLISVINDERFAGLNDSIQENVIIAFSRSGEKQAVDYLTALVNPWKLMPTLSDEFYRRVAFRALAANRSDEAEKALVKLSRCLRGKIRRMANQARVERLQNLQECNPNGR